MKACGDFKPFVTNVDVCDHYNSRYAPDFRGDPEPIKAVCRKGHDKCPTGGLRPERLDQESDSEE